MTRVLGLPTSVVLTHYGNTPHTVHTVECTLHCAHYTLHCSLCHHNLPAVAQLCLSRSQLMCPDPGDQGGTGSFGCTREYLGIPGIVWHKEYHRGPDIFQIKMVFNRLETLRALFTFLTHAHVLDTRLFVLFFIPMYVRLQPQLDSQIVWIGDVCPK